MTLAGLAAPAVAQLADDPALSDVTVTPALSDVKANPASIELGESSALQWTPREDVARVVVTLPDGTAADVGDPKEGRYEVTPSETFTYTLEAYDEEGALLVTGGPFKVTVTVRPTWADDAVLSNVKANPASIELGESSALQWTPREDVARVVVTLPDGTAADVGDPKEGRYEVTPSETFTYTLEAYDEEGALLVTGGPFKVTVTVRPTWADDAVLSNVKANPASIELGESSALQWTPREDVARVVVTLPDGTAADVGDPKEGRYEVTPSETFTYTLEAYDEEGALLVTGGPFKVTVTVRPTWADDAVLSNVKANPASIELGESSALQWTPREDVARVVVTLPDGTAADVGDPKEGRYEVTPSETFTYTLEAYDEEGALLVTGGPFKVTVTVRPTWADDAVLSNVKANPASIELGESSALQWTPREDVARVVVTLPDGTAADVGDPKEGRYEVTPSETFTYTLEAYDEEGALLVTGGPFKVTVTVRPTWADDAVLSNVKANPASIELGESSALQWTPREDVARVVVTLPDGTAADVGDPKEGRYEVTPSETFTYTLEAYDEEGALLVTGGPFKVTVTVRPTWADDAVLSNVKANPASIELGESSALQWTPREDVARVVVTLPDGTAADVGDPKEGRYEVTPSETFTYTLEAYDEEGALLVTGGPFKVTVTVRPTWADDAVLSNVKANPASIELGESSALQWTPREDVARVVVTLPDGTAADVGDPKEGRYEVTPSETFTYTLEAYDEEGALLVTGGPFKVTVTVRPTWADDAVLSNVKANPASIELGESSALQWTPREDVARVVVTLPDGTAADVGDPKEGRYEVTPSETFTYTLEAYDEEGALLVTGGPFKVTVTVRPTWADDAVLSNVKANPASIELGESSALQWTPREDVARVVVTLPDGTAADVGDPKEGRYEVTPSETFTYTLEAYDEEGALLVTGGPFKVTVTVRPTWADDAVLSNVKANPASIKLGESSALQWTPREDVARVVVTLPDGTAADVGDPKEGRYEVTPSETFTYTLEAYDEEGALLVTGGPFEATVTVTPVRPKPTPPPPPPPSRNTAPVAGDDEVTLDQGGRITLSAATLLANDRDADGDTLRITAVSKATANISVSPTPASSWRITSIDVQHDGADTPTTASFEYTITDSAGATATATVTLTIALTVAAPVIDSFSASAVGKTVTLNWALGGGAAETLTLSYFDDGDDQEVTLETDATSHTLTLVDTGEKTFMLTATNAAGTATDTATVTVLDSVAPVIDRFSAPETVMAGEQVTLSWALSGGPVTGIEVTYSAAGDAQRSGTLGKDEISWATTVAPTQAETVFTLTVTGPGGVVTRTVTVSRNRAPVAEADTAAVLWGGSVTLAAATLLSNDTDADGDPLVISAVQDVVGGVLDETGEAPIEELVFTHDGASAAASFAYSIEDSRGGQATGTVSVTVSAPPPAQPAGLRATAGDAQVTLAWSALEDSSVTHWHYQQRAGRGSYGAWQRIPNSTADTTSHTLRGLVNGTPYSFRVRAVNAAGAGAVSDEVTATPVAAPAQPAGLRATAGDAQVTLAWSALDDSSVTHWHYQQRAGRGSYGAWQRIPNSAADTTSHTVRGLVNGTPYSFRVRAVNAAGAGAVSDEVTATPVAAPAQPAGLRATAGDAQVTLAWSALDDSSVTHWHYQQRAGRGSYGAWQSIPNSAADTTSHTLRGLVNGTPYSFRVRAVNAAGDGAVSDEVTATPQRAVALARVATHWLARFGRTLAGQVVDVMHSRVQAAPTRRLTLGGQDITLDDTAAVSASEPGDTTAPAFSRQSAHQARASTQQGKRGVSALAGDGYRQGHTLRTLGAREFWYNSAFSLALAPAGSASTWSLWGRATLSQFEGRDDDVSVAGEVVSGYLGLDWHRDRFKSGVIVSHTGSDGDYGVAREDGDIDASLTSGYAWLHWLPQDALSVWALAGLGRGELELKGTGTLAPEPDLDMHMVAGGLQARLPSLSEHLALALKADVFALGLETDSVAGLAGLDADSQRLRLLLEASSDHLLSDAASLRPSVEIGARWDNGDAEDGVGLEVGAGLEYRNAASGVRLSGRGHWLVTHEKSGFEEWGASVELQVDPGRRGQGFSLRLAPTWGLPSAGAEGVWADARRPRGQSGLQADRQPAARMELQLGYGMEALSGRGLLTPYTEAALRASQVRRLRSGLRMQVTDLFEVDAYGEHRAYEFERADKRMGINLVLRF